MPALLTGMLASMAEGRTHSYDFVVSTILAPSSVNPRTHAEYKFFFFLSGYSDVLQLNETNFTRLFSTKSMTTVNDSFPGPVILIQRGDLVYVNVHNQDDFGVTIHWYGSILLLLIHSVSGR